MPTVTDRTFSAREAADLAGISYRQIDYWCRTDVFVPSVDAVGSGSRRGFTWPDVQRLAVLATLRRFGLMPQQMGVAEQWLAEECDGFEGLVFVSCDGTMRRTLPLRAHLHLVLDLAVIDAELRSALEPSPC